MSLLESILRSPISALNVADRDAFKAGPDTFNVYRLALENGPDLSTEALLDVISDKGLTQLASKCAATLGKCMSPRSTSFARTRDHFLESYEWATVRYRVLVKHGNVCQACHKGPNDGVAINVDHIEPRRKRPELALTESNLQVLCADCNKGKGNWDSTDWRQPLEQHDRA